MTGVLDPEAVAAVIAETTRYLLEKYDPLLALLYGSFAAGTAGPASDIDVLCFAGTQGERHDDSTLGGFRLDAVILPLSALDDPSGYLHVLPCRCLHDPTGIFPRVEKRIGEFRDASRSHLAPDAKLHLDAWIRKMLARCSVADEDGCYRYVWLVHDFPELYCNYLDLYYDGPKKTIERMRASDPATFAEYSALLKGARDVDRLARLYESLILRHASRRD